MENTKKLTISERINARLKEPADAIFKDGKWRFWFVLVFGLSLASAVGTALIFPGAVGSLALSMGVLLLWVFVGTLHYSDSNDPRLARGVSILDSIALCFVIAHFCFVMWVLGHLSTLRAAEGAYKAEATAYNERLKDFSSDNVKIAEAARDASASVAKAEKLRNDTAYQLRRAAEAGARVPAARQSSTNQSPSLQTAPIDLEKPKAPDESSTAFLSRWDAWIRGANFGELILAAITLIYIRNRSAKFNSQRQDAQTEPLEAAGATIPSVATVSLRQHAPAPALRRSDAQKSDPVATVGDDRTDGLRALRAHLKEIKRRHAPDRWFKADLIDGGVSIRLCERQSGREATIAQTWQSNKILAAVDAPDFRARLIAELIHQGFPIGKGGAK